MGQGRIRLLGEPARQGGLLRTAVDEHAHGMLRIVT
jgi:hypothetical protein